MTHALIHARRITMEHVMMVGMAALMLNVSTAQTVPIVGCALFQSQSHTEYRQGYAQTAFRPSKSAKLQQPF